MGMANILGRLLTLSSMSISPASIINLHQSTVMVTKTPSVPLVVRSYQTGPVHSQDTISDPQSAVRGSRPVRDQSPDVNAWSIERGVLQEGNMLVCVHSSYTLSYNITLHYIIIYTKL